MFWKFQNADGLGGRAWVVHCFQAGAPTGKYILLRKKRRELPSNATVLIFELYVAIENLCGLKCHTKQGFAIWRGNEQKTNQLDFLTVHPSHSDLPRVGFQARVEETPVSTSSPSSTEIFLRKDLTDLVDMYDRGLPTQVTMHDDAYAAVKFPYYFLNGHQIYGPCFYQTRRRRPLPLTQIQHAAKLLRPGDPFFACQMPAIALRYSEDMQILNKRLVPWDSFDPASVYNAVDCEEKGKVIGQAHGAIVDADPSHELANYLMTIALVRTGQPRGGKGGQSHIMVMAIPKEMLHSRGLYSSEGMVLLDTIHFSTMARPPTEDLIDRIDKWQPTTPDGEYECGNIGALQYYFHNCPYFKSTVLLKLMMFGSTPNDIYALTPITKERGQLVQGVCLNELFGPNPDDHIVQWAPQFTRDIPEWHQMIRIGETWAHPEVPAILPPLLQKTSYTELKSFFIASDPDKYTAEVASDLLGRPPLETLVELDGRGYSSIVFAQ